MSLDEHSIEHVTVTQTLLALKHTGHLVFSASLSPFPLFLLLILIPPSLFLPPTQSLPFLVLNMEQELGNIWEIMRIAGGPVRGAAEANEDPRAPKSTLLLERKCGKMRERERDHILRALLNNKWHQFPYSNCVGQERFFGF